MRLTRLRGTGPEAIKDISGEAKSMASKAKATGLAIRERVLGKAFVDHTSASDDAATREVRDLMAEFCYGAVWSRPGLGLNTRSLLTVAVLAALNHRSELRVHVQGALNLGIPRKRIVEALIHLLPYVGAPAVHGALRVARAVFAERDKSRFGKKRP